MGPNTRAFYQRTDAELRGRETLTPAELREWLKGLSAAQLADMELKGHSRTYLRPLKQKWEDRIRRMEVMDEFLSQDSAEARALADILEAAETDGREIADLVEAAAMQRDKPAVLFSIIATSPKETVVSELRANPASRRKLIDALGEINEEREAANHIAGRQAEYGRFKRAVLSGSVTSTTTYARQLVKNQPSAARRLMRAAVDQDVVPSAKAVRENLDDLMNGDSDAGEMLQKMTAAPKARPRRRRT